MSTLSMPPSYRDEGEHSFSLLVICGVVLDGFVGGWTANDDGSAAYRHGDGLVVVVDWMSICGLGTM